MRSVLISIQPKWCELIAGGKKTIEIRKTKPKLETPFKVYIYCTKSKKHFLQSRSNMFFYCEDKDFIGGHGAGAYQRLNGKVIGEFVCDEIECFTTDYRANREQTERISKQSCVSWLGMAEYEYNSHCLYAWHISNLVIYDKPRELVEFQKPCIRDCNCGGCENAYFTHDYGFEGCALEEGLTRPPQSWCYVESGDGE